MMLGPAVKQDPTLLGSSTKHDPMMLVLDGYTVVGSVYQAWPNDVGPCCPATLGPNGYYKFVVWL
jgi:hypothetical protein